MNKRKDFLCFSQLSRAADANPGGQSEERLGNPPNNPRQILVKAPKMNFI